MKKAICLLLILGSILVLVGCDSSYEISGMENYSKNLCSKGTCDRLLPTSSLLVAYSHGEFYYWTDGNYTKAKAFMELQYPEDTYLYNKSVCESYYSFSQTEYLYENYLFSMPNRIYEDSENLPATGMYMFGYNDSTCSLIFIGFSGYAFDHREAITPALFREFFGKEFGGYL